MLIIQRANPPFARMWSLPGGHVDAGETLLAAAHRELLEETGVKARLKQLAGMYTLAHPDGAYMIACYTGRWKSGKAMASGDALSILWALPAELDGLAFTPNVRDAIERARLLLKL
ncbi:MAG: NUDIX domain-containing protein [Rhizobiales bacterium]|nr:NUDIX domain-containing protein [Hyphomicrobiales bacterium]